VILALSAAVDCHRGADVSDGFTIRPNQLVKPMVHSKHLGRNCDIGGAVFIAVAVATIAVAVAVASARSGSCVTKSGWV
jgi:hypothetical protein